MVQAVRGSGQSGGGGLNGGTFTPAVIGGAAAVGGVLLFALAFVGVYAGLLRRRGRLTAAGKALAEGGDAPEPSPDYAAALAVAYDDVGAVPRRGRLDTEAEMAVGTLFTAPQAGSPAVAPLRSSTLDDTDALRSASRVDAGPSAAAAMAPPPSQAVVRPGGGARAAAPGRVRRNSIGVLPPYSERTELPAIPSAPVDPWSAPMPPAYAPPPPPAAAWMPAEAPAPLPLWSQHSGAEGGAARSAWGPSDTPALFAASSALPAPGSISRRRSAGAGEKAVARLNSFAGELGGARWALQAAKRTGIPESSAAAALPMRRRSSLASVASALVAEAQAAAGAPMQRRTSLSSVAAAPVAEERQQQLQRQLQQ